MNKTLTIIMALCAAFLFSGCVTVDNPGRHKKAPPKKERKAPPKKEKKAPPKKANRKKRSFENSGALIIRSGNQIEINGITFDNTPAAE